MLHFMSEEAHSLLQSIIVSSQEVVYASDEVESAIRSSLLNNANIIKILYEKNLVTNILLKEIAEKNKLNRIHIIGKNGVKKYTSSIVSSHKQLSADFIKNQLEPIFSNKLDTLIVGFKNAREEEGIRYVVAIASSNNDAIVLNLNAEELLAFKKRIGFGVLIRRLTEDRAVKYAILENENGILAASGDIERIKALSDIDSSSWSQDDSTYRYKISKYGDQEVLESVHPFDIGGESIGYYRIGLSLDPLERINDRLQRRVFISAIVLFVIGFIIITIFYLRQNLEIVKKQYLNIETYSKNLIESVSDSIVVCKQNGIISEINKSAQVFFESTKKNLRGKKLSDILNIEFPEGKDFNGVQQFECLINGRAKELLISRSKFIDENENENTVFIIKDLTELKKLEKQIARNEQMNAMGQLASGVAHEIRNPLNSIATIVQQLDKDFEPVSDNKEYHSLAKIVSKEVKRMNETIENFLRFSKPEPIQKSKFILKELLDSISNQFTPLLLEKGIKLSITQNWDGEINWDRNQIKQVLINLLKNSIEAISNSGKIDLIILNVDNHIVMKIVDNGEGIPKENLQKIFNLYFTSKAKGTGIGLSIIQRIINEHDGIITVESDSQIGTTFTISLPINNV